MKTEDVVLTEDDFHRRRSMSIKIDLDALDARLANGERWITGWGDYTSLDAPTCLHGAIRYCQPIPGDAYLIEQVSERYGFGIRDNDAAESWADIRAKVITDITDDMLEETFGPQWEHIVAIVRRVAVLTTSEFGQLAAAWDVAWDAARDAARAAAWDAAQTAALDAAWDAAWAVAWDAALDLDAAWDAAWAVAWVAARALVVRDLIGQHGFTQSDYDVLVGPWTTVIGKAHPDD